MIRTRTVNIKPQVICFDHFKVKTASDVSYIKTLSKNIKVKEFKYRMVVRSIMNKNSQYKIVIKILQKKSKELWVITNWGELNIKNLQHES